MLGIEADVNRQKERGSRQFDGRNSTRGKVAYGEIGPSARFVVQSGYRGV